MIGMALFILAILLMTGIDRYHAYARERIPASIVSVLFEEPIEKYTAAQTDLKFVATNVGEARHMIEELGKKVPRCSPNEVGGDKSVEQCGFADEVHGREKDLIKYKFKAAKKIEKNIAQVCANLVWLIRELKRHPDDAEFIGRAVDDLAKERESQYTVGSLLLKIMNGV